MIPSFNLKGEAMCWNNGIPVGYKAVDSVDNHRVLASIKPVLIKMKEAAKKDGVDLTVGAGLRTYDEQMELRKAHLIDKSKIKNVDYLTSADSGAFNPVTAKPGYSNHHDGTAIDFNVTGKPDVYKWLVNHAIEYGFVRKVQSERWHWELIPGADKFSGVPKNHPTWDNLV